MQREEAPVCDAYCIDEAAVRQARESMLAPAETARLAETFKALGDPTRIRILHALSGRELCVCDLAAVLEMGQSAVSHQLRTLRNLRLVKFRREGKTVYYSLDDQHITTLFREGLDHVRHGESGGEGKA